MSIVDNVDTRVSTEDRYPAPRRLLHRLATVRRLEGISRRALAQRMKVDVTRIRRQEEASDLPLSVLYQWHKVLDVPIAELLVESEYSLSQPLVRRAQLVRLMKTAMALLEEADSKPTRTMAQTLVDQLLEIMPALQGIVGWNATGTFRTLDDLGVAALRTLSMEACPNHLD
jgi:transcriptional regulator with XRE-family HTH domain